MKSPIYEALVERADVQLSALAEKAGVSLASPEAAFPGYAGITENRLVAIALEFFDAWLHDPALAAMRRLFVTSQYRDPDSDRRLRDYWIKRPLAFQAALFERLFAGGKSRDELDPEVTALAFFGPVFTMLQLAESGGDDEEHARAMLAAHVRQFRLIHLVA